MTQFVCPYCIKSHGRYIPAFASIPVICPECEEAIKIGVEVELEEEIILNEVYGIKANQEAS